MGLRRGGPTEATRRGLGKFSVAVIALALAGCAAAPPRVARVEFGGSIWTEGHRRGGRGLMDFEFHEHATQSPRDFSEVPD